jgi:hypothetical protein
LSKYKGCGEKGVCLFQVGIGGGGDFGEGVGVIPFEPYKKTRAVQCLSIVLKKDVNRDFNQPSVANPFIASQPLAEPMSEGFGEASVFPT